MIKDKKMVSIGYALGSNACRCMDSFTFELHISRDVILKGSKESNWDSKKIDDKGGEIKLSFRTDQNWDDVHM